MMTFTKPCRNLESSAKGKYYQNIVSTTVEGYNIVPGPSCLSAHVWMWLCSLTADLT